MSDEADNRPTSNKAAEKKGGDMAKAGAMRKPDKPTKAVSPTQQRRQEQAAFQARTNEYARRAVASMKDDLDALEHAQSCKGTDEEGNECKRGQETHRVRAGGKWVSQMVHNSAEAWHDEDRAREEFETYSVQVRSDWHTPGDRDGGSDADGEYTLLLGGGGPASRIIGDLEGGEPHTARFQFQDWFKPWTDAELSGEEEDILLRWAQVSFPGIG